MSDHPSVGLIWRLEDDKKTVTLSFTTTPPVQLQFDVAGVERVLRQLGAYRAVMPPDVQPDWKPGQSFPAIFKPSWSAEVDMMQGHTVLHFRDPRFGWLHYVLPPETARPLAQEITKQLDNPRPMKAPGKAS